MDNPHLALLSRTTGRLIGEREGCDVDVERVLLRARARLRDRSARIAEGDVLGIGRDFIAALRRTGNRVEPVERAPVPIATRDP